MYATPDYRHGHSLNDRSLRVTRRNAPCRYPACMKTPLRLPTESLMRPQGGPRLLQGPCADSVLLFDTYFFPSFSHATRAMAATPGDPTCTARGGRARAAPQQHAGGGGGRGSQHPRGPTPAAGARHQGRWRPAERKAPPSALPRTAAWSPRRFAHAAAARRRRCDSGISGPAATADCGGRRGSCGGGRTGGGDNNGL